MVKVTNKYIFYAKPIMQKLIVAKIKMDQLTMNE